jgi:Abnormal spindle-like microcephaly-assoc'd, ASPM-SPD-2-Hydin
MKWVTWGKQVPECKNNLNVDPVFRRLPVSLAIPAPALAMVAAVVLSGCVGLTGGPSQSSNSAAISLSPSSVSFGDVSVGERNSQPVTVSNPGNSPLTISTYAVTGTGFSASGLTTPLTIQPGHSASFNVFFGPTSAASESGSVSFASNANSPESVSLSGTGTDSYTVSLAWTASSSPVAGYNVYRGTVSGVYAKLNSSLVAGDGFTDPTVQSQITYYYVVTAVDSAGVESTDSNRATVTVP